MSVTYRQVVAYMLLVVMMAACGGSPTGEAPTTTADTPATTTTPEPTTSTSVELEGDPAPPLAGTSWAVTHYYSEEFNSTTNLWPDTEITISFDSDSQFSGNAGCNDFQGSYTVSGPYIADPGSNEETGQTIEISDLSWTEMACEGEDLMTQEAEFLAVLPRAARWLIGEGFTEGDGLLIRSNDGLILEASPTS